MASIHEHSTECTKSELDLFTMPYTQTAVESSSYVEFNSIATITDQSPIEFCISSHGLQYIDPANIQLYVRAQIVNGDGSAIGAGAHVNVVNNFLHSLFSEVEVKLNDKTISTNHNTYAYRAYIENLLSFGGEAKKTHLTSSLFYHDKGSVAGFHENDPLDNNNVNGGAKARYELISGGKIFDMVSKIHSDIFYQDKYLPNDVNLRLRLVRNKDAFCLMSSVAAPTFKVKIHECKLIVRKVTISNSVFLAHAAGFEKSSAKYPIRRVVCKTYTIPAGCESHSQEQIFSNSTPTRLIIGLVENSSFNGAWNKNPFCFQNFDAGSVRVFLDGEAATYQKGIETNYGDGQYINAYASLFTGSGKWGSDEGNDITRAEYPGANCLLCWDLSPDQSADQTHFFNLSREASLRVDIRFKTILQRTINVVIFAEFENIVEILRNRDVLTDFN